jgi:hypothetical protein
MADRMTLLDIVTALNRELRANAAFCALLRDCDEAARSRITASYIDWLYRTLDSAPAHQRQTKKTAKPRHTPNPSPRDPSIAGFCQRKGISRATYYNNRARGLGPAETQTVPGGRITITLESEAEWEQRHTHFQNFADATQRK